MRRRLVDTETRYEGVYGRHQASCALGEGKKRCNCRPRYYGVVWDRIAKKRLKTGRFDKAVEARDARADVLESLRKGVVSTPTKALTLAEVRDRFLKGMHEGVVLNKYGRKFRKRAAANLESSLNHLPDSLLEKPARDVRPGEIQTLADELAERDPPLSGSRIRSVIYGTASLYQFAKGREFASHNPADEVRLPASEEKPRDFVVTPAVFAAMLDALEQVTPAEQEKGLTRSLRDALRDKVPYALAAYGTARNSEIKYLDWSDVYFEVRALELAADEEGRKPGGSWRIVPMVEPLSNLLREEWEAQGRPESGKVIPSRKGSKSGLAAMDHIQERVRERWCALDIKPIGLHEARHTAATWMDTARVPGKVASEIMGHKTPTYQPGAARITLQRYTHVLPGELERARELLDAFLRERTSERNPKATMSRRDSRLGA